MNPNPKALFLLMLSITMLGGLALSSLVQAIPAPSIPSVVEPGSLSMDCTYYIYIDSSGPTYMAKNCQTGQNTFSSTTLATVLTSVYAAGNTITWAPGKYVLTAAVTIPVFTTTNFLNATIQGTSATDMFDFATSPATSEIKWLGTVDLVASTNTKNMIFASNNEFHIQDLVCDFTNAGSSTVCLHQTGGFRNHVDYARAINLGNSNSSAIALLLDGTAGNFANANMYDQFLCLGFYAYCVKITGGIANNFGLLDAENVGTGLFLGTTATNNIVQAGYFETDEFDINAQSGANSNSFTIITSDQTTKSFTDVGAVNLFHFTVGTCGTTASPIALSASLTAAGCGGNLYAAVYWLDIPTGTYSGRTVFTISGYPLATSGRTITTVTVDDGGMTTTYSLEFVDSGSTIFCRFTLASMTTTTSVILIGLVFSVFS